MKFGLKSMLLSVLAVSGCLAALSYATADVAQFMLNLMVMLLVVSAISAAVLRRATSIGFLIAAISYFLLVSIQPIPVSSLYTTKIIAWASSAMLPGENSKKVEESRSAWHYRPVFRDIADDLDRARGIVREPNPRVATEEQISAFLVTGHCSATILLGLLGSFIAVVLSRKSSSATLVQNSPA